MDLVKTQHVKLVTDVNRTNYLLLIITVLKRLHQNPMVKNNHHTIYTDNISVCLILYTIYTITLSDLIIYQNLVKKVLNTNATNQVKLGVSNIEKCRYC